MRESEDTTARLSRRELLAGAAGAWVVASVGMRAGAQSFSTAPLAPPEAALDPMHGFWEQLREDFPLEPGHVHFDTAGCAVPPRQSLDAMARATHAVASGELTHGEPNAQARTAIAQLVGTTPDNVALAPDELTAMSWIADALPLERRARVVTILDDAHVCVAPWLAAAREKRIALRRFAATGNTAADAARVHDLLDDGGVLVLSHVLPTTGALMPIAELLQVARERGAYTVVQGSQAVGLLPVDVASLPIDAYVASGHGWMLGPLGTSFVYVRPELIASLRPRYGAPNPNAPESVLPIERASDLETRPLHPGLAAGLVASLDWLQNVGRGLLHQHATQLAERLHAGLVRLPGIDVLTPSAARAQTAIVTFRVRRRPNTQVATWLERELGMRVARVDHNGYNAVRASTYCIHRALDVDWLVSAAQALA